MNSKTKIGIIICDRYRRCAGGKCLRAMRNREGAFSIYPDTEVELVGFTTCDGCPGGNIEYACESSKNVFSFLTFFKAVEEITTGLSMSYPDLLAITGHFTLNRKKIFSGLPLKDS